MQVEKDLNGLVHWASAVSPCELMTNCFADADPKPSMPDLKWEAGSLGAQADAAADAHAPTRLMLSKGTSQGPLHAW